MPIDFVIRIGAGDKTIPDLPRIVPARYEPDHLGIGKVARQFDAYAATPRIARSFQARDPKGSK